MIPNNQEFTVTKVHPQEWQELLLVLTERYTYFVLADQRHNVTDEEREHVKYWYDYVDNGMTHSVIWTVSFSFVVDSVLQWRIRICDEGFLQK